MRPMNRIRHLICWLTWHTPEPTGDTLTSVELGGTIPLLRCTRCGADLIESAIARASIVLGRHDPLAVVRSKFSLVRPWIKCSLRIIWRLGVEK